MLDSIIEKEKLRKAVGLTIENFDEELIELENAAIKIMELSGIHPSKIKKDDSLIVSTITAYVKGNFRFTDLNLAEKFKIVFEENKNFMRSTTEYTQESSE